MANYSVFTKLVMSAMSEDDDAILIAASIIVIAVAVEETTRKKKRRRRQRWTKEWIAERERLGAYNALVCQFTLEEREDYRRFMRMNTETFHELLEKIRPFITKQTTIMRKPLSPEEKLAVTLRFLGTGDDYDSLSFLFRISRETIRQFVPIVCHYIYHCLKGEYLKLPSSDEEWAQIANRTYNRWQYPNAIAAADGKHIAITKPVDGGSEFRNYKGFHSIVLMALVRHDYTFLYADVGCQGRISDGGVWANCEFAKKMSRGEISFPPPKTLPKPSAASWSHHDIPELPYVLVGDSAFPLQQNLMKPYPDKNQSDVQMNYNYRHSRFRRVSENAFGILVNRFRIYNKRIDLDPDIVVIIVRATLALHNLLCTKSAEFYSPSGFADEVALDGEMIDGTWRDEIVPSIISPIPPRKNANKAKLDAVSVREGYADYFFGPGEVPWQWNRLI